MKKLINCILFCLILASLSSCGVRGKLYLPHDDQEECGCDKK